MQPSLVSIAKRSRLVDQVGGWIGRALPATNRLCTVLTFHRLDTGGPELYPGLAGLEPSAFERLIDEVSVRFQPIGIDRLLLALAGESDLPPRSLLITFDDAYRDFADVAWPIMQRRDVPVVLFVPTAFPGHPSRRFWWDALYGAIAAATQADRAKLGLSGATPHAAFRSVRETIKSMPHEEAVTTVDDWIVRLQGEAGPLPTEQPMPVLDWDELAQLACEGVCLAPHSRTHPMLERVDSDRLDDEILGSLDDMRDRLGPQLVHRVFAYPSGGYDPRVRAAVRRAGFDAAFTTDRGLVDVYRVDPFRLPRLNVGRDTSIGFIEAECAVRRMARRATWLHLD